MKIVKKLSFTLIEVGLALFLGAVMIGLLFSTFTYTTKIKKQIEHASSTVLKRKYIQEKLTQVFSAPCCDLKCAENIVTFAFDQGPDLEKAFSGKVKAKLFLENSALKLSIQSPDDAKLSRSDTLFDGISSLEWTFLSQPEAADFGKDVSKTTWDDKSLPLAIRLTLNMEDGTSIPFAFFTSSPIFEMPQ